MLAFLLHIFRICLNDTISGLQCKSQLFPKSSILGHAVWNSILLSWNCLWKYLCQFAALWFSKELDTPWWSLVSLSLTWATGLFLLLLFTELCSTIQSTQYSRPPGRACIVSWKDTSPRASEVNAGCLCSQQRDLGTLKGESTLSGGGGWIFSRKLLSL